MTRWTLSAAMLMLAACSGGTDDKSAPAPDQVATAPASGDGVPPAGDTDMRAHEDQDGGQESGAAAKSIPVAVQGRWGLVAADCTSTKGDAKGLLTIDAANLRFYESHGELRDVRERNARHIVADYKFSGEGTEWTRRMTLDVADGGKTLIRRDDGEGSAAGPMRYTRCAA